MRTYHNNYIAIVCLLLTLVLGACVKDYENPADGTRGTQIRIFHMRQFYSGGTTQLNASTLGGGTKIQGIVSSTANADNLPQGVVAIQETYAAINTQAPDITSGVLVRMNGTHNLSFGDSIEINLDGASMTRENGKLIINGISTDRVTTIATGKMPTIRYITGNLLTAKMEEYESTLVSFNPNFVDPSGTLSGFKELDDLSGGGQLFLETKSTSSLAGINTPANARVTGIAGYSNEGGQQRLVITPRNSEDLDMFSGKIYEGFPERFETPAATTKASYNSGTNLIQAGTGTWWLFQSILAATAFSDKFNYPGLQGIRVQQNLNVNAYLQMNFDVPDGASKVSVFYGRYGADNRSSFRFEYSTDGGTTWIQAPTVYTDMPDKGINQATWLIDVTGPVRFRVNKLGLGGGNGRLSLDDFAVYRRP